ncbi:hypothetical protein ALQ07_200034 [Pseudomonas syringae pv. actinidiae]|uniref:Uncharacterized protein n=1 Tax=Pseudomonas syringae pv. actinidiae TaxID=103796 RepID=A0A3M4KAE5_PSESF|nr:hypothetical protein ALQ07_200034 [Pseudomonas syringae pv. actinidiae]
MLLWLRHTTGMRVIKLDWLQIGPAARSNTECTCAEITKGRQPRNVCLPSERCLTVLDAWLATRRQRHWVHEHSRF